MSHQALKWALGVTSAQKLPLKSAMLLIVLADYHNPQLGCFPSQETLCARLHASVSTVRRSLATLIRKGLVRVVPRGRRNGYELLIPGDDTGQNCAVSPVKNDRCGEKTAVKNDRCDAIPPYSLLTSKKKKRTCDANADGAAHVGMAPLGGKAPSDEEDPVKAVDVVGSKLRTPEEQPVIDRIVTACKRPSGPKASELAAYWRDLHAIHMPHWCLNEMLRKDQAVLLKAYQVAGPDFVPALAMALRRWDDFLLFVKLHGGHLDKPKNDGVVMPRPGFVLLRVAELVAFYRERVQPAAVRVEKAKKPAWLDEAPVKAVPKKDAEPLPTLEEVLEILGGD